MVARGGANISLQGGPCVGCRASADKVGGGHIRPAPPTPTEGRNACKTAARAKSITVPWPGCRAGAFLLQPCRTLPHPRALPARGTPDPPTKDQLVPVVRSDFEEPFLKRNSSAAWGLFVVWLGHQKGSNRYQPPENDSGALVGLSRAEDIAFVVAIRLGGSVGELVC